MGFYIFRSISILTNHFITLITSCSILNRIVDNIISDFKSGHADSAPFWIQMQEKFIHIEYFALRNEKGEYLGTVEVSQDLTAKRKLENEQRILNYGNTGMAE